MTSRRPNISVIIPCFNGAPTIGKTIESTLDQAEVELEVVVIDDGSTDLSLAIARSYEPAVRAVAQAHRGVSAARNRGIDETIGDWIVFLDADDLLMPGTLGQRLEAAQATGADVVICDWQDLVDCGEGPDERAVKSIDMKALLSDPEIACATHIWATTAALMFRRSLVNKIAGFRDDLPVIQDARFLFDAAFHKARFARTPHIGARYRIMPQSLSRRDPARFWRDVLRNGIQIEQLWRARGHLSSQQREALREVFDHAGRGLFGAVDKEYYKAIKHLRSLEVQLPLHPRVAGALTRLLGLNVVRSLFRIIKK